METKTKNGLISLMVVLSMLGVANIPSDHNYFCKDKQITYHCDSLSKYYSLPNGKCINNILANKLCRSGWVEIDWSIPEEPIKVTKPKNSNKCIEEICTPGEEVCKCKN